ncbi:MAG: ATP-binding protein [Christensenellales bacterium]
MNRRLTTKLNTQFSNKRIKAENDRSVRFAKAMQDKDFCELYTAKRSLENELARRSAYKLDAGDLRQRLDDTTKAYDKYVASQNIDLDIHYQCPHCQDTGWVGDKPCRCYMDAYCELLKKEALISPLPDFRFEDNNLEELAQNVKMQQLYPIFQKFCDNFDNSKLRSVYLSGAVGVGKTSLLSCIANNLIEKGKYVVYVTAFDWSRIVLAKHLSKNDALSELYDSLLQCDLLIIDDLGTEPMYKNVSLEYFLSIVDWRIGHGKKTILSTNLTGEQFVKRYGERAFSRICNKAYAYATYIDGTDLRKIKPKH